MISLDTNILVRLLTGDDRKQMAAAIKLIDAHPCFVPMSVALELEWVLRGAYGLTRAKIADLYDHLLSAINLHFEGEPILLATLRFYKEGLDFADALHLSSSTGCDALYTFDKKFLARAASFKPPCHLPES